MSLQKAAKYLESKGRNGDSMLVHMTPGEVKGLQALALAHGGSLSVNPDTGLVEASFLKNLLPVIAGAALNYFAPGIGTAIGSSLGLGGAAGTGILVGGLEGLRTGDVGRGITAGLGAFGGAGLAGGAPTTVAGNVSPGVSTNTAIAEFANASKDPIGALADSGALSGGAGQTATTVAPQTGKYLMAAAAPTISDALTPKTTMPSAPEEEERYKSAPYRYNLASNFSGYVPPRPNPYYRPAGLGYAAGGGSTGDIMMAAGGSYADDPIGDDEQMAAGGSIGGYSDGGRMLKGPGDGMSDDIPAIIGKRQPARLADGEFVVPADVVSHLGNGSTDAGAKRLYSMMDNVRKARTGRKKQAPAVKADKFIPA